ncbi:YmdB family metallophosphoesterase, partial [Candidatus Poribacteria bacterium]|nr:YmdB family metallophosphoesterase [Candidatus Poribacteria bacterium]
MIGADRTVPRHHTTAAGKTRLLMRIVFIGDIVGKPGRRAVKELLPALRERHGGFDLVIANAENAAGGNGITAAIASELTDAGIDLMTMGNHVWDQKEFADEIADVPNVIRPANLPKAAPGRGWAVTQSAAGVPVAVLNLGGGIFFNQYHNPFEAAEDIIPKLRESANVVVLDFHAEATSEKIAMGRFLDGKASLVVGT